MSKFKSKLARRIMALVLSGAMVMSNMSAYAAELAPETVETGQSVEIEEPDEDATDSDKTDTSKNEKANTSEEDNKIDDVVDEEGTITVGKPGLAVTEVTDNGKITAYKLTWADVAVTKDDGTDVTSDYTVTYDVKVTYVEDEEAKSVSGIGEPEIEDGKNTVTVGVASSNLVSGTTYTFSVTAKATEKNPADGETAKTIPSQEATDTKTYTDTTVDPNPDGTLGELKNLKAELNEAKDAVVVSWTAVSNAESYEVAAIDQSENNPADAIIKEIEAKEGDTTVSVTFDIVDDSETDASDGLVRGKSYTFSVTAKKEGSESVTADIEDALAIPTSGSGENKTTYTYVLEAFDMTDKTTDDMKDLGASEISGKVADGDGYKDAAYFTLHYSNEGSASKIEGGRTKPSSWTAAPSGITVENTAQSKAINMQGTVLKETDTGKIRKAIEFTTEANATVKVWWQWGGGVGSGTTFDTKHRNIAIYNADGEVFGDNEVEVEFKVGSGDTEQTTSEKITGLRTVTTASNAYFTKFEIEPAGTYYLGGIGSGGSRIYKVEVSTTYELPSRKAWGSVSAPTITAALDETDATKINVTVDAVIGYDGGDELTVAMLDAEGNAVETKTTKNLNDEYTFSFSPTASGNYKFKAELSREGETDKKSAISEAVPFGMPKTAPNLKVTDKSNNDAISVEATWNAIVGAEKYSLTVTEKGASEGTAPVYENKELTETTVSISEKLERGKTYVFTVYGIAKGNADEITDAATAEVTVKEVTSATITTKTYVFDVSIEYADMAAQNLEKGGSKRAGEDDFFTVYYRNEGDGQSKLEADSREFKDPDTGETVFTSAKGINLQAGVNASTPSAAIKFETTSANAQVVVYWRGGGNGARTIGIKNSNNELVDGLSYETESGYQASTPLITKFTIPQAGTYYLGGIGGGNRVHKVEVTVEEEAPQAVEHTYIADISAEYADIAAQNLEKGGSKRVGEDDFFTIYYRNEGDGQSKLEADSREFKDPDTQETVFTSTKGINLQAGVNASTPSAAIKFETTSANAQVVVYWRGGGNGARTIGIKNSNNELVDGLSYETESGYQASTPLITKFTIPQAGTYYLGGIGGGNRIHRVEVTTLKIINNKPTRVEWPSEIAAPVITDLALDAKKPGTINVTVSAVVNYYTGGDKVTVYMKNVNDADGNEVSASSAAEKDEHTIALSPEASGTYTFRAVLTRNDEDVELVSAEEKTFDFILPLSVPTITRATNDGKGGVEIAYSETAEAEKYVATAVQVTKNEDGTYKPADGATPITVERVITAEDKATTATFTNLTIGEYYAFTVHAVRGTDEGKESDEFYKIIKNEQEQVWDYSSYGESTSTNVDRCSYSGDANDGEVSVWSLGGSGKIVPNSADGVSFYYTRVDKDTNFVLEATAVVDEWTYSNGQEGFGLMVTDTVGPHGHNTTFWNNSYMAVATKMEYYWNGSTILSADVGPADDRVRYNMYLGLGSIARTGVTDEWKDEQAAGYTAPSKFVTQSLSLENAAALQGLPGGSNNSYNVIANRHGGSAINVEPLMTEIRLRIEKNNTGYFITYIDKDGEENTHKFYEDRAIVDKDYANQSLLQIDKDNVYVGFFAARNAKATFKDIRFTTSSVDDGGEPEEKPITYNIPTYSLVSPSVSNSPEYEINFSTNWKGTLSIKDSAGRELVDELYYNYMESAMTTRYNGSSYEAVSMLEKFFDYEKDAEGKRIPNTEVLLKADVKAVIPINDNVNQNSKLGIGSNVFTVSFTPDRTWHRNDDELQMLTTYDTSVQTLTVSYRQYGEEGNNIYVSPDGKATGDGTTDSPLDIYTAVKYVQQGQTIVLLRGTYNLKRPITIERGIDGKPAADGEDKYKNYIKMIAEPGTYDRTNPFEPSEVVIDFNGVATGMTIAGDYWYFRGFDVTNSADGNKGIQVSGSNNVLDQVNTYKNGNTGIQISRYRGTDVDKADDWPSNNTILNCTSYLNADSGVEDADGFAAKLTIGDGNVFDGCIAAYNADDGWDFFAKAETGPIGQVIIKNSVTFKNGYLLENDNGELDIKGKNEKIAGNGNGFKMGGESITGYHMVINSYSFYNKLKGIDANSCPDIQAYNSISFNNKGYNVAFYTNTASKSEFRAGNLISFRTNDVTPADGSANDQKRFDRNGSAAITNASDCDGASNFYWDNGANAAKNKDGKAVTADWFKSLEYKGVDTVKRNANGTINMGDFLAFSDKADTSVFVKLQEKNENGVKSYTVVENAEAADVPGVGGSASIDANAVVDENKNTLGDIVKGDDEDLGSTDTWTDEEFAQLDVNGTTLKILMDLKYDSKGYYADYTGVALKPAVRVAYGPNELSNKNYSIGYKNNVKAYELRPGDEGFDPKLAPTIVIKGKGNYAGEYNFYYVIRKIDLASSKVVSADITTVATGRAQKINPVVTFSGKKLGENKDYKIAKRYTKEPVMAEDGITPTGEFEEKKYEGSYESAGTYYIELEAIPDNKGQANFTGTKTIKVEVLSEADAQGKTPMSKVKVDKILDQVYDGTAHEPAVNVQGLTKITETVNEDGSTTITGDYDIAYYDNTDVGVASVVLTGYNNYYGTKTVTFKTVAKPFNVKDYSIKVEGTIDGTKYKAEKDEEYKSLEIPSNGSAITFSSVVVKVIANEGSEDKVLTEGVDYTVSYKGNNKAGSASIVVKGMGDFKGTMNRTFKITPLEITSSNTTVEPIGDQVYVKGGVKPSVIVKVNGRVISPSNYTVSYKNNNALSADKGPASVSIAGKNLLKGSLKDVRTFNIVAKDLRLTNIVADNVYYGTAKNAGDGIAYLTKLAVKDGNKTLSLGGDYTVTYYEEDGTPVFDYNTGELKFRKTVTINNEDGTTKEEEQVVAAKPLEKNSKIKYDGSNKTIYAVITGGKNKLYTGATFASYKVVGKNDIRTAKITKITDIYTYNDGSVAAPKLEVKIQNRHLESGKYVKDTDLTPLKLNEDYEIIDLKNNDKAGSCTITIKGMGYYAGTNKTTFKIDKKDLSAWNAYLTDVVVSNITVEVDEADIKAGGKYAGAFTFDDIIIASLDEDGKPVLDDDGKPVTTKETSPLAKAASGKIYTVGTKTSGALTYGTDYTAENYTGNTITKLEFDEQGYHTQEATVTIKGVKKDSGMSYTGSKTIRFTIKVKKTPTPEQTA